MEPYYANCIELGNEVEALEEELKNLQTEPQRLKEAYGDVISVSRSRVCSDTYYK